MTKVDIQSVTEITPSMCPVSFCLSHIGGKWKPLILHLIRNDINRFGQLSKHIHNVSKQMLTTQLRELEADGIISRKIYPEIPPRVEYSITKKGIELFPIVDAMISWGQRYMNTEA